MRKKTYIISIITGFAAVLSAGVHHLGTASDHDDGSQTTRQNNLNLTDLFAFREDNQTGNGADSGNLIFIMDSNGHTPAGQQVFFNTQGQYDFHITRISDSDAAPTGKDDVVLRFEFGEPDQSQHQPVTVTAIKDGQPVAGTAGQFMTTSLADGKAGHLTQNQVPIGNSQMTVFAGLREDPFFFDSEQFFKVRAGAAGLGPKAAFKPADQAVDAFAHQNVNSIAVRIPISFLQTQAGEKIFDVWEITSTKGSAGKQIDRLARPAVNEGLSINDSTLNAFNSIPPSQDLSPAAQPVLAEDANTLKAFAALGQSLGLPPAPPVDKIVGAFIPDVMRIDTRVNIPPGTYAYNAATSPTKGILIGGRKLEDDTIDITLSFLVAGDATGKTVKDNVAYEGVPGNPNQPGHQLLIGQTQHLGPALYPFVTTPN